MKKYFAEFLGTMILVFFGCGTAVFTGGFTGGAASGYLGVVAIALAFGLAIIASAYAIGSVSGCHVNPAVSLGMLLMGRLSLVDFAGYVAAQLLGGFTGALLLRGVMNTTALLRDVPGLGQNGYRAESAVGISLGGAFLVELVLSFVFVSAVIGVTTNKKNEHVAGIVIGLTLAFVHILGIPLTGTSVNPARSLGPALVVGGVALRQVWVFLLAPLAGAALSALVYRFVVLRSEYTLEKEPGERVGFIIFR